MTTSKTCILCNTKTNWPYFQELKRIQELTTTILDNTISLKAEENIICAVESFNHVATGRLGYNVNE